MVNWKSTINAVGTVLLKTKLDKACNQAEEFAQKRYYSKLERPDQSKEKIRRENAWLDWMADDEGLTAIKHQLYSPQWAIAKLLLRKILKGFKLGPVSFTTGSEFVATRGRNSIESKLSVSEWTCTPENFDLWADTVYRHRGLKTALRRRLKKLLASRQIDKYDFERRLWKRCCKMPNPGRAAFEIKLGLVTEMVYGNRFSTVPKNNEKNRPICIEPLANILTQRRIGLGIRACLIKYGIDLNDTAEKHRIMIGDSNVATIDLKNASDRISLKLVKYLLPQFVFDLIDQSRSAMTLGPDDSFYVIEKVSSMGNGFTFELMSLILTALCKSYAASSTVFGDDIIIPNQWSESLIQDLENAGFIVNRAKTHINDAYRESCGAHYLDGHGYIESYDFRWPENIGEVVTISNKLAALSLIYPSFRILFSKVYETLPATLYADNPLRIAGYWQHKQDLLEAPKLDTYTVMSPFQFRKDGMQLKGTAKRRLRRYCRTQYLDPRGATLHYAFEWVDPRSAPDSLDASLHWAKVLMYLAAGRRSKDSIRGLGHFKSFLVVTLRDGSTFRWTSLCSDLK